MIPHELFAAVYDDPSDDSRRAVLADALVERGDPRGEFIALQLDAKHRGLTNDERRREQVLLGKHERAWRGELDGVLGDAGWWSRGFIAGAQIKRGAVLDRHVVASPLWSTVEYVWFEPDLAEGALRELFHRLRSLRGLWTATPEILGWLPRARLDELDDVKLQLPAARLPGALAILARAPRLTRLGVIFEGLFPESSDELVAFARRLGQLSVTHPRLSFALEGETLSLSALAPDMLAPLAETLRARRVTRVYLNRDIDVDLDVTTWFRGATVERME
jgi:uncharacterized protein (TIGR02996 family)